MNTNYEGRYLTIKSSEKLGRIQQVITKRGTHGLMHRFLVLDEDQKMHELMPHEVTLIEEGFIQEPEPEDLYDATSKNQYDEFKAQNDEKTEN